MELDRKSLREIKEALNTKHLKCYPTNYDSYMVFTRVKHSNGYIETLGIETKENGYVIHTNIENYKKYIKALNGQLDYEYNENGSCIEFDYDFNELLFALKTFRRNYLQ